MVFEDLDYSDIPISVYTLVSKQLSPKTLRWIIMTMTTYQILYWIWQCMVLLVMMMRGATWILRIMMRLCLITWKILLWLIKFSSRNRNKKNALMIMTMVVMIWMLYYMIFVIYAMNRVSHVLGLWNKWSKSSMEKRQYFIVG
ncbi:MAG: 17 kDa unknown protein [Pastinaca cytorhabdovirus 1]|uniref:Uncharacterized protein n=1 Tax=Pastinaca cytorhabdovirus 1 TaxID=2950847 RepID=A0AAE9MR61_9RHAB|nr:MAG: 17 kDa unknown protein [Pastinaca cytorhabdovirus 1]